MENIKQPSKISVVICTCNGEDFIDEQISSILNQSLSADEILVFDDASDDDTIKILIAAVEKNTCYKNNPDQILKIKVHPKRLGVVGNFQYGIQQASNDLIVLCDQDDRWHVDRLKHLKKRITENNHVLLLHGDAELVDEGGKSLNQNLFDALNIKKQDLISIANGNEFPLLLRKNLVTGATTIFRKQLLDISLPIPPHWLHDEWLGIIAAAKNATDAELRIFVEYRQHSKSQIGVRKENMRQRYWRMRKKNMPLRQQQINRTEQLLIKIKTKKIEFETHKILAVEEKLAHHKVRANLPTNNFLRIPEIFKEIMTGRYWKFSEGFMSILDDLLYEGENIR